jgi:hypothetical protein
MAFVGLPQLFLKRKMAKLKKRADGLPPCVRLKTIQVNCTTLSCLVKVKGKKMRCMCGWIALFAVLDPCFICKV